MEEKLIELFRAIAKLLTSDTFAELLKRIVALIKEKKPRKAAA